MYNQQNDYITIQNVFKNLQSHFQTLCPSTSPLNGICAQPNLLFVDMSYKFLWPGSPQVQACTLTTTPGKPLKNQSIFSGLFTLLIPSLVTIM